MTSASCRTSSRRPASRRRSRASSARRRSATCKRFQRAHHLDVDGIVGPQVVAARCATSSPSGRARSRQAHQRRRRPSEHLGDRTLKKGMKGHDVRVLQDYLSRAGVATPVDGAFGPSTLRNVKRFQRAHGLTVDGRRRPAGRRRAAPSRRQQHRRRRRRPDRAGAGRPCAPARRRHRRRALRRPGGDQRRDRRRQPDRDEALRLRRRPRPWNDNGYDCSGSVSYALHGGGLIGTQLDSGSFMSWGARGTRPLDHGLRELRPRVHGRRRPALRHQRGEPVALAVGHALAGGYTVRHPAGF